LYFLSIDGLKQESERLQAMHLQAGELKEKDGLDSSPGVSFAPLPAKVEWLFAPLPAVLWLSLLEW